MRSFTHINARTLEEACLLLEKYKGKAVVNAGGTDLLGVLKDEILPDYPKVVINIKNIPGLDSIIEAERGLTIGSLTKLSDIAGSLLIKTRYPALAEAAYSVATPQIRNAATIGGNLCQDVRCWYYRYPSHMGEAIHCARKGSGPCLAVRGDNRYHAVMGGKRCFAVCPSDTAVALAALDGYVHVSGPEGDRTIAVADFFGPLANALGPNEIVKAVEVPALAGATHQRYIKFALRVPVDFAIVSVAAVLSVENRICTDARIALGAVAAGPVRARSAEEMLKGKEITKENAAEAAEAAMSSARPLSMNSYKIEISKVLIKRALLGGG
ncbi:MAG TPA: FAD binding domain-containing protein [Syntrophorhabdaceae bacterium]|nr:FAD binding domain-containing protein [Syntrophorhabdaceae bacterium]HQM81758.1 FAD binding domain-containing protein [Syntrophorhabdaceae bacterium]